MKFRAFFLSFSTLILVLTTGCEKQNNVTVIPDSPIDSIPFENNNIKIDFAADLPSTYVRDMHFFDASNGIVISNAAEIYQTKNAGVSWVRRYAAPDSIPLHQLFFTDNNTGYAVGGTISCSGNGCIAAGGRILKTTDGGNSWQIVLNDPAKEFVSIAMNSKHELFVVSNGAKNEIFKSADNGSNWTHETSSPYQFYEMVFNGERGFITTLSNKWLISNDNGITWNVDSSFASNYSNDIEFNDGVGYCFSNLDVLQTTDNGESWISQGISGASGFGVVKPLSQKSCIVFGSGSYSGGDFGIFYGAIWQLVDGNSWTGTQFKNTSFYSASFYTATNGYVASTTKLLRITVK